MARVSARWQAQLASDLATGQPIPYRRVPGRPRTYYNPRTGREVSEHYVLRIYRPALDEAQRAEARTLVRAAVRRQQVQVSSLLSTWQARQASLGQPVTARNVARKDAEFRQLVQRLRIVSYQARHTPYEDAEARARLYASDGEYAQILVQLGRRLPDAGFPVGESALQVGAGASYINEVVLPALRP